MGIAGEIAQDFLGAAERALAVDYPFTVAQRCHERSEVLWVGERGMAVEELKLSSRISGDKLLQEEPAEQSREHAHREEEVGSGRDPALAIERQARDILPRNTRSKLSFTTPITLVPENASSRSDESSTEVAFILRSSRRMVAVFCSRRG